MSKHYLPFRKGTKVKVTQGDKATWSKVVKGKNVTIIGHNENSNWLAYDLVAYGDLTVLSITKGTIVSMGSGYNSGWGNSIVIKSEDGTFYRYSHLRDNPFNKHTIGKKVTIGTDLGIMGNTGKSSGPHLHLERTKVLLNTVSSNPDHYLKISFLEDNNDVLNDQEILYSQHPGVIQDTITGTDNNTPTNGIFYITPDNLFSPTVNISYHNGEEIIFRQGDGQVKAFLTNEKGFAYWYHHTGWADSSIELVGGADIRVGDREELIFDLSDGTVASFLIDNNGLAYKYQVVGKRDKNFKLIAGGNFDNDQLEELLFDEGNGRLGIFDMNANGIAVNYRFLGSYGTNEYKVIGTGDINGDGRDEILFGGKWGDIGAFNMNDNGLATNFSKRGWAYSDYHVVGIGNIDADNRDELVLRNPRNGEIYAVHFDGNGNQDAYKWVGYADPNIKAQGLGDITGDGRDEIVFRVGNGEVSYFTINENGLATQYLVSGWADANIPII